MTPPSPTVTSRRKPCLPARAAAATAVTSVAREGRSLTGVLESLTVAPEDRALTQELSFGVLRWYRRLDVILGALLSKPLKRRDAALHSLLLVGLYQLLYTRVPPHAAVAQTVAECDALGSDWARGLVNGVLRNAQRRADVLQRQADADPGVALAHPDWLLQCLREDWPEHWQAIAGANNERPPMTLRVNRQRVGRQAYLQRLAEAGMSAEPLPHAPDALRLSQPVAVSTLPGFADGLASVQDEAAQLAAGLLDAAPGDRVLDACAAPGGKTAHLLERTPGLMLTAVEVDGSRLQRLREGMHRLGLKAHLCQGDAGRPQSWWDGEAFDRILLDAPCSATGVIRRHPDIKWLRRPEDVAALTQTQAALLEGLWALLRPGGVLLYATCSILRRENAQQVTSFIARAGDAREQPIMAPWGRRCTAGRQILPGEGGMDGFYFARIQKTTSLDAN